MISLKNLLCITLIGSTLLTTGCATQPHSISRNNHLESSPYLSPNMGKNHHKNPYMYSTDVDWSHYSYVFIEPVTIDHSIYNQFGKMPQENKQELAHYMQQTFTKALEKRFSQSQLLDSNTLRVKLTLIGAKTNTPVISTFTRFDLMGLPINSVQAVRGKEGIFIGHVNYAVEVYDASNNRLLKSYIAKEYPNAMNVGATFGRLSAAKIGLDKGAHDLLKQLK